jgi:anaerobic ribonucleoside-triphosphate reductase activating protein
VLAEVLRNPLCRGVTFSGGEPFAQAEGLASLAKLLKEKGYEVASYSGYTFEQLLNGTPAQKQLLESIDILIDGPFLLAEKSLELNFRGSKNQRILDVPASLENGAAVLLEE